MKRISAPMDAVPQPLQRGRFVGIHRPLSPKERCYHLCMHAVRRHQRLLTHIALLAMLALAIWPTLLRVSAWTQAQPSYLSVLCSTALKASPAGAGQAPTPDTAPAHAALDHCPLCALAHVMAPPAAPHAALLLSLRQASPSGSPQPLLRAAPRLSHHPRGPPHALA